MTFLRRIVLILAIPLMTVPALGRASENKAKEQEWPMYRGDAARANRGTGGPPTLEAIWRQSLLYEREGDVARAARAARRYLRQAEFRLRQRDEPIIPAFAPIAVAVPQRDKKRTLLLFKNYFGVMAVDLRDGQLRWISPSSWSLQRLLAGVNSFAVAQWLKGYQGKYPQILFENSTIGTLSTDGQFVYVVEDLAVPPCPYPQLDVAVVRLLSGGVQFVPSNNETPLDKELEDAVAHNRLYALSLTRSGALTWALGDDEKGPLNDCYFLGPPLPLAGKLYVLADKQQEIRLICLETKEERGPEGRTIFTPRIASTRTLGKAPRKMENDALRRTWAAHLAYGEGILVCPTNAGAIFGVDLRRDRLAWAYTYREKMEKGKNPLPQPPGNLKPWKTTAPVIAEDKVVFAPPDDSFLHCLNLSDGSVLWSRKKSEDDVYFAGVYSGKVLIVGVKSVQALSLAKGEIVWTQETGLPSGQGIAAGEAYYLPLAHGTQSKQPEILVLDMNKGQAIAHHKMPPRQSKGDDAEVPGNLVFVEGKLISLTPWDIVVYPRRGGK